ncbi:MAG: cupin domain-containing protein [Actinomycetota bacterium]
MQTRINPFAVTPEQRQEVATLGSLASIVAAADETGGSLGAIIQKVTKASNPPLHVHANEDEAWLVIDGEIDFHLGDDVVRATPGTFVFAPRGLPHSFDVVTPEAQLLILVTPGGFEGMFRELGAPLGAAEGAPPIDPARVEEVAGRYGLEIVGPPPRSGGM